MILKVIFSTIFLLVCYLENREVSAAKWSYDKDSKDGPSNWGHAYPDCNLKRQSPIAIKTDDSVPTPMTDFKFSDGYFAVDEYHVINNNGHTVQLTMSSTDKKISGGNLGSTYRLAQLHMHWGRSNDVGSEHLIDGKAYPLEIHLVHFDEVKYQKVGEALKSGTGLAVLGVMVKIGERSNGTLALEKFIESLPSVANADESDNFTNTFPLIDFLPCNHDNYFRYLGSLTTPPCSESVVWTVFQKPIEVTSAKMNQFRKLLSNKKHEKDVYLVDNFRPIQKLNGRIVQRSFPTFRDRNTGCFIHDTIVVPVVVAVAASLYKFM